VKLVPIARARRDAIRVSGATDRATHARLLATLGFEGSLDRGDAGAARRLEGPSVRVVAWNLERCKHVDASAALLRSLDCDVALLSEMDWGMARSDQLHTTRELAERLGASYAFGVEYLELDLGSESERAALAGQANDVGFHGNAIVARCALHRPTLVRLDARGDWFDGARGERRVGGRCAVLAQIEAAGRAITCAAVHLDSHGSRADRAEEMRALLDAIDAYDRDAPTVIGGDLNSFSLSLAEIGERGVVAAALRDDPGRWANPVAHEPLFAAAAGRGYEWSRCNAPGFATLRHATDTGSRRGVMKIDWFLTRGIEASEPRVVDAVGADGRALSDHEAIAVDLRSSDPTRQVAAVDHAVSDVQPSPPPTTVVPSAETSWRSPPNDHLVWPRDSRLHWREMTGGPA
jgi:endonuclease/exonuclease/phosphatase family metal-dependent hydrolase